MALPAKVVLLLVGTPLIQEDFVPGFHLGEEDSLSETGIVYFVPFHQSKNISHWYCTFEEK